MRSPRRSFRGARRLRRGKAGRDPFRQSPTLFRHFIEQARDHAGSVYGRRLYEVMRYWDEDHPEWDAEERDFAAAWRKQPKWVVSHSLKSVSAKATLVEDDVEAVIRRLKANSSGPTRRGRLKSAEQTWREA
jgi:dihydrofolate reductase